MKRKKHLLRWRKLQWHQQPKQHNKLLPTNWHRFENSLIILFSLTFYLFSFSHLISLLSHLLFSRFPSPSSMFLFLFNFRLFLRFVLQINHTMLLRKECNECMESSLFVRAFFQIEIRLTFKVYIRFRTKLRVIWTHSESVEKITKAR